MSDDATHRGTPGDDKGPRRRRRPWYFWPIAGVAFAFTAFLFFGLGAAAGTVPNTTSPPRQAEGGSPAPDPSAPDRDDVERQRDRAVDEAEQCAEDLLAATAAAKNALDDLEEREAAVSEEEDRLDELSAALKERDDDMAASEQAQDDRLKELDATRAELQAREDELAAAQREHDDRTKELAAARTELEERAKAVSEAEEEIRGATPTPTSPPEAAPTSEPAPAPAPAAPPPPPPPPAPAPDVDVYYENCAAARAAGAAPVYVGEPGYGPHLDRDRDGVGCE